MHPTKLALICLLLLALSLAREEDIVEYDDSDFSEKIAQHDLALVMFYAPWCRHCKRLKPEYAKAADSLTTTKPPIGMARVDCTEGGKETCNKYGVSGYPSLMVFRKGKLAKEYDGPREASDIVDYMKAQLGPSSREVRSVAELQKYLKEGGGVLVVGLFEDESDLKTAFMNVADKLRGKVRFAHSAEKDVLDEYDVKDGVMLFRPFHLKNQFESDWVVYEGTANDGDIRNFITRSIHGLVGHRTSGNMADFRNPKVVGYYDIDYIKNPKGTNYWRNRMLKVARIYKDQINFAISDKDDFQDEVKEYGIDEVKGDTPVILARDAKNQKFIMNDTFSTEAFDIFVRDFLTGGKLKPYIKSEPIPEKNDEAMKVAVAMNFDEVVINNGKDTMIEFYAPWCQHCQKLAPVYEELAEKLKNEDIVIAKMDATANDVPDNYTITGIPALYWLPKNAKDNPIPYEGGHDLNDFLKYIAENASFELKDFDKEGNPKATVKIEL